MNGILTNRIWLDEVHGNFVSVNCVGGKDKKKVQPVDGEYFQFDVTPLDSGYPLIS